MNNNLAGLTVTLFALFGSQAHQDALAAQAVPLDPASVTKLALSQPYAWAGVKGPFPLVVRGTGYGRNSEKYMLFLNSEADYRAASCLTIEVRRGAMKGMRKRFGEKPDVALMGRAIVVRGEAHRVKIRFSEYDAATGYYYQTHVRVTSADQITLVN